MRLTQRLLLGAALIVGSLVLVSTLLLHVRLRERLTGEAARGLARDARLVALQWDRTIDPDSLADAVSDALGHRVTLVDTAGRVVGDSEFDAPALDQLENHAAWPEIREARARGEGIARRLGPSASDEELYVAVRTRRGVARVSLSTRRLDEIIAAARRDVFVAGLLALVVAGMLSYLFARAVTRPIVELRDVAQGIAAGDLARRPALSAPAEVGDLAVALHRLAEQLGARLGALQAEDALLSALVESLIEGVVAIDGRQRIVRINRAAVELLGLRETVPFHIDRLPRDRTLRESVTAALTGEHAEATEMVIGGRMLAITARPLPGGGAVLALLDLTPARRLEAVRRDFVANVSHELRTPLTAVGGFAETLLDEDLPPEQRHRFAQTIRVNAQRMQRIVDDLLDLSRIESGGWVPKPAWTDASAAASDVGTGCAHAAHAKDVQVDVAIEPAARLVWADPTAVRQVLSNLADNAVRHTPAGGRVTIFARSLPGGVAVGVRDTGIGIPGEHLPRVFERFYRVDPARSREAGGTGLGLAIVKHLVEAHGGRVVAESEPGRGTTMTALFPFPPGVVDPPAER